MRSSLTRLLVAVAATLLVGPQLAMAEEIEEQLRLMNERMGQLEDQLQATQDELDNSKTEVERQSVLIEKAGLARESQSGLSAFLSETQISGFVAASWTYNIRNPSTGFPGGGFGPGAGTSSNTTSTLTSTVAGENIGALGITAPHHQNHNSFQVDQAFLSFVKPATAESRGGWGMEVVWGANADAQGVAGLADGAVVDTFGDVSVRPAASGDLTHLYQAYVEYLAPIGSGIWVKGGRFETLIGAESFRADSNYNITRGAVWAMQPVNHTGIMAGGDCDCGLTWALAAVNDYSNTMADSDNSKTLLGRIGMVGENYSVLLNGLWGGNVDFQPLFGLELGPGFGLGNDNDELGLLDFVVTVDVMENLALWANFDWYAATPAASNLQVYAVAGGGRLAITESTGFSVRYEYINADLAQFGAIMPGGFVDDVSLHTLTGTIDHALTDNLIVKLEGRYDNADINGTGENFFMNSSAGFGGPTAGHDDQTLFLAQMLYTF